LSWHLVRCIRGHFLESVTLAIRSEVGPAECFYRRETLVLRGTIVHRRYPLFQIPYIFADWVTEDADAWHRVKSIRGVSSILGGVLPACVPVEEVEAWRLLADLEGVISEETLSRIAFEVGESVEFTFGAFEEKIGEVVGYRGQAVGVKISFLGGETVIYLAPNILRCVERAPDNPVSRTRRCRRNKRGGERRRWASRDGRFLVDGGASPISVGAIIEQT
jgi:hypothetical protein